MSKPFHETIGRSWYVNRNKWKPYPKNIYKKNIINPSSSRKQYRFQDVGTIFSQLLEGHCQTLKGQLLNRRHIYISVHKIVVFKVCFLRNFILNERNGSVFFLSRIKMLYLNRGVVVTRFPSQWLQCVTPVRSSSCRVAVYGALHFTAG